jgi:GntR family transcriptional regulator, transcriptional repressor for pyruvate dehydrogenase complex
MTATCLNSHPAGLAWGDISMNVRSGNGGGSLVSQAMDAVTGHIRGQRLKVGDTLPGEAWFAAELGVSRAVMREAFGALAALRLIDVGNGRKPRVSAIDGSVIASSLDHAISTSQVTVPDIWDVRRTIEQRTAALAAARRSEAEAAEIVGHASAMADAISDLPALTQHDIAFHMAIAKASHNALFLQIVSSFAPLMQVAVPAAWETRLTDEQRERVLMNHRDIAAAIATQDPSAAAAAMSQHFDASIGDILKAAPIEVHPREH